MVLRWFDSGSFKCCVTLVGTVLGQVLRLKTQPGIGYVFSPALGYISIVRPAKDGCPVPWPFVSQYFVQIIQVNLSICGSLVGSLVTPDS